MMMMMLVKLPDSGYIFQLRAACNASSMPSVFPPLRPIVCRECSVAHVFLTT